DGNSVLKTGLLSVFFDFIHYADDIVPFAAERPGSLPGDDHGEVLLPPVGKDLQGSGDAVRRLYCKQRAALRHSRNAVTELAPFYAGDHACSATCFHQLVDAQILCED